ncbi:hypothetical protein L6E12_00650 [Actinokineospora sp. PR83]|uniref:hypothetical protein n=1 Tax=Actinokineospora sp. PR83 TaxID=2884908 RepID=UPI001F2DEA97|nr:hypothetical protein [Actinokineospora sp. PR83]MCG8914306.1 hypothetical protein [Actinokineospora sp. PR83]
MTTRLGALVAAGALAVLLAGCSAESGPGVASAGGAPSSTAAPRDANGLDGDFAECMRANGADLEDSKVEVDDTGGEERYDTSRSPQEQRAQQEALEKCKGLVRDGGAPEKMDAEALEKARAFAKCVREQGVDYPDPSPDAGDYGGNVTQLPEGVDGNDPRVQAALRTCGTSPNLVPLPGGTR